MRTAQRRPLSAFLLFPALCAILFLATACAELSASHLQRKAVEAGGQEHITGKFLVFDYEARPVASNFAITGTARPNMANLPAWADMVQELSITAYLCDENGTVLAQEQKNFHTRKLSPAGLGFVFSLSPKQTPAGQMSISFGYRGTFASSKRPPNGGQGPDNASGQLVFFASEGAVLKN